jgi:hypothetical protein
MQVLSLPLFQGGSIRKSLCAAKEEENLDFRHHQTFYSITGFSLACRKQSLLKVGNRSQYYGRTTHVPPVWINFDPKKVDNI